MKKILYLICSAVLAFCLYSCGDFGHKVENADETEYAEETKYDDDSESEQGIDNKDNTSKEDANKDANNDTTEKTQETTIVEPVNVSQSSSNIQKLDSIQTSLTELSSAVNDKMNSKSGYSFLIFGLIFLLGVIGCLLKMIYDLNKKTDQIKNELRNKTQYPKSSSNQQWDSIQRSNDIHDIKVKLNGLIPRIEALEKKVTKGINESPRNQSGTVNVPNESNNKGNQADSPSNTEQSSSQTSQTESKVFYMPRTSKERIFDVDKKKLSPTDGTYFKFTIKSPGKAEFIFDPENDSMKVKKSFDDRIASMQTVCEILPGTTDPKECKTVTPGEAELQGNVWRVTKKVKIVYN